MRYLIILFLFLSVISCKSQLSNGLKSDQTVISSEPKMDWLFGKNYKKYDPSDTDIETAVKIMEQGFDDQKRATVNRLSGKSLDEYYKQFVGAIDENGDRIIWINCFCKKEEKYFTEWKEKIVYVADGGNCFFNVKVNVSKNTYTDFRVNGNA